MTKDERTSFLSFPFLAAASAHVHANMVMRGIILLVRSTTDKMQRQKSKKERGKEEGWVRKAPLRRKTTTAVQDLRDRVDPIFTSQAFLFRDT
jgi:hypothetical protein